MFKFTHRLSSTQLPRRPCEINNQLRRAHIDIHVPWDQRDAAKKMGASWDSTRNTWKVRSSSKSIKEIVQHFSVLDLNDLTFMSHFGTAALRTYLPSCPPSAKKSASTLLRYILKKTKPRKKNTSDVFVEPLSESLLRFGFFPYGNRWAAISGTPASELAQYVGESRPVGHVTTSITSSSNVIFNDDTVAVQRTIRRYLAVNPDELGAAIRAGARVDEAGALYEDLSTGPLAWPTAPNQFVSAELIAPAVYAEAE